MTGASTSGPVTAAQAAPELIPKTHILRNDSQTQTGYNQSEMNDRDQPAYGNSPWLRLALWLVVGYAVLQLGLVLLGLAFFPAYAREQGATRTANDFWTVAQTQAALQELGWPAETIAWFDLGRDLFFLAVSYTLGLILLRRKSRDWFGLYLALVFFLGAGNTGSVFQPALEIMPAFDYFFNEIVGAVSWQLFFILLFFFPTGKPVPGWTRWMIFAWLMYMVVSFSDRGVAEHPIFSALAFVFVFSAIGSQVYRQWKISGPIQKQQTKWVVYALVTLAVMISLISGFAFEPPASASLGRDLISSLFAQAVFSTAFLLVYGSILIAILRYRLYDIDLVIRRTLQYSLLTVLLAMVYFGGVVLLQNIFGGITGQTNSPLIIVISTLVIAGLFNPLRLRILDFIDRRFYRKKYNAEQAIVEFAAIAQNETDLEQLSGQLISTIQSTLQPDQIILWLKMDKQAATGSLKVKPKQ
jgi:hypothetical protein